MNALKLAGSLLPLLLALDAAAAVVRVSPVPVRINPLVGLPTLLPSPLTGPLAGHGVTLPSPVMNQPLIQTPQLPAPRVQVGLTAADLAAAMPMGMDARRENVAMPALLPESVLRFAAAADSRKAAPRAAVAPRNADDLRNLFDGSRQPSDMGWEPINPRRRNARGDRRHGLPEDELERELGVEPQF
ncbi:MAG: hypothetical protein SF051_01100 [Elusimicrobiota bacterium]|nr:hypothetical protein [Elusimicrobiota bacterium]